ncbi:MAG: UDP-N-acetylglucosamine 1-carboxyvinyltransferase, partial [Ruminiclostridium sp.]|nr:UDP-N-acetylglucosamine 1-carboxyvinyltransferase [Ruminiclostridium sp.]
MSEQRRLIIKGGRRIEGELAVQGAKNSALPLLAAAVLCKGQTELYNCPRLSDCDAACRILSALGCSCKREGTVVCIDASALRTSEVSEKLMREMRSSIIFMGALLGRTGQCRLSFPGGCEIGSRPIDFHIDAFRKMGAKIREEHGYIVCSASRLRGARISFPVPSVGATENVMLAAVLADGVTEIHNAAREPEICDLAGFLTRCGAKIEGAGTGTIHIEGVKRLSGCRYTVMPDRIAAATYLCCGAITRGEILLTHADLPSLGLVVPMLEQIGCSIYGFGDGSVYLNARKSLKAPSQIRTSPYPGFPTDAQPPFMALCSTLPGTTMFAETIFENRYRHVSELTRLGAKIKVEGRVAVVEGVNRLSGAELEAGDLRGGAAMVTAALFAEGTTKIGHICYINRGYENIEGCLRSIGA